MIRKKKMGRGQNCVTRVTRVTRLSSPPANAITITTTNDSGREPSRARAAIAAMSGSPGQGRRKPQLEPRREHEQRLRSLTTREVVGSTVNKHL